MLYFLKGNRFDKIYASEVRIKPVVNRTHTNKTKEGIKTCQVQHKNNTSNIKH